MLMKVYPNDATGKGGIRADDRKMLKKNTYHNENYGCDNHSKSQRASKNASCNSTISVLKMQLKQMALRWRVLQRKAL